MSLKRESIFVFSTVRVSTGFLDGFPQLLSTGQLFSNNHLKFIFQLI